MPNYAAKRGKQTGTKNTKRIGAALKKFGKTINPWGPIVPNTRIGKTNGIGQTASGRGNFTGGSSTRKPTASPQLRGMDYPRNDPTQWPVEPDFVNHTRAPDPYGITPTVIANVNKSIEDAYTRDGYQ